MLVPRRRIVRTSVMETADAINAIPGIESRVYLELGVYAGETISRIKSRQKFGVDKIKTCPWTTHTMTTTEFLSSFAIQGMPAPQVVFIDADHSPEAVAADLRGVCDVLAPGGVVFCHDMVPPTEQHVHPGYCNRAYCVLIAALRLGVPCFSAVSNFGLTCFPTPRPIDVSGEDLMVAWDELHGRLPPENRLSDADFLARCRAL